MDIKLLVLDIDGTLIDSPRLNKIPERVVNALRRARQAGVRVCLCSGRPFETMRVAIRQAEADGPYICCNGAYICSESKLYSSHPLLKNTVHTVLEVMIDAGVDIGFLSTDRTLFWAPRGSDEVIERFGLTASKAGGGYSSDDLTLLSTEEIFNAIESEPVYAISISVPPELEVKELQRLLYEKTAHCEQTLDITESFGRVLTINSAEATKGNAVKSLAQALDIPLSQVMAVGDNENDLSMLEIVGCGCTTANASDTVKAKVSRVLPSVTEGGVADGVERYIFGDQTKQIN